MTKNGQKRQKMKTSKNKIWVVVTPHDVSWPKNVWKPPKKTTKTGQNHRNGQKRPKMEYFFRPSWPIFWINVFKMFSTFRKDWLKQFFRFFFFGFGSLQDPCARGQRPPSPDGDEESHFEAPNSSKIALLDSEIVIRWPILTGFGPEYENGLFWTKSIQIGDYFSGQNARFGTIYGLKMAYFPF